MDWLAVLADWANRNEGLIAMLAGTGALAAFLFRQRATAIAVRKARDLAPAKVVVRSIAGDAVDSLSATQAG